MVQNEISSSTSVNVRLGIDERGLTEQRFSS